MIGLDTNVIVRHLVQDDPAQAALATAVLGSLSREAPGFMSTVVLVEVYQVLKRAYRLSGGQVAEALHALVSTDKIVTEQPNVLLRALREASEGHDLADVLVAQDGERRGCTFTMTFDRSASRIRGMRLLENGWNPTE